MSNVETMSHVDLLDTYGPHREDWLDQRMGSAEEYDALRAEILRRMDSARTSSRGEIAPDKSGYQR